MERSLTITSEVGMTIINLDEVAQFRREGKQVRLLFKSGVSEVHHFLNESDPKELERTACSIWGIKQNHA